MMHVTMNRGNGTPDAARRDKSREPDAMHELRNDDCPAGRAFQIPERLPHAARERVEVQAKLARIAGRHQRPKMKRAEVADKVAEDDEAECDYTGSESPIAAKNPMTMLIRGASKSANRKIAQYLVGVYERGNFSKHRQSLNRSCSRRHRRYIPSVPGGLGTTG